MTNECAYMLMAVYLFSSGHFILASLCVTLSYLDRDDKYSGEDK